MKRAIATAMTAIGFGLGGALLAASAFAQDIKIGAIYDFTGPFAGGGSKAAAHRHQDRDRHDQRARRRRGPQDRRRVRRRAVEDRRRDQRGRAAAQRAEGRSHHGRLFERALRADGRQGRCREEIHVDQHLRRLGGVEGQEAAIRVPPAGALRPVRRGLLHLPRRERQGQARQGASRTSRSRSSTRTARTASASRWATRRSAKSSACRSCTRKPIRRPRPISPRW